VIVKLVIIRLVKVLFNNFTIVVIRCESYSIVKIGVLNSVARIKKIRFFE
jgi:hypothetical protein